MPGRVGPGLAGMAAGLDQDGGGTACVDEIPALVRAGKIAPARIEQSFRRQMRARLRLGMMDPPALNDQNRVKFAAVESAAHLRLARRAAAFGLVAAPTELAEPMLTTALRSSGSSVSTRKFAAMALGENSARVGTAAAAALAATLRCDGSVFVRATAASGAGASGSQQDPADHLRGRPRGGAA